MSRKATFSPKSPKPNSSEHNSRKEIPNYLIENDPNFEGNYYERMKPYESDKQFVELAKKVYNKKFIERIGQNQSMQKKQVEALFWEVAISTEKYHTKENILALFKMLKNEKSEENEAKRGLNSSYLKPIPEKPIYVLPKKLRQKRKPKKENLYESGYHILELAGHADEGHFIRKGKWDNLAYYPARDILFKDDGNWYIKSNELNEDVSPEVFDVLADMTEFEKVYNYHWHVKYTNFNVETGLSAQFTKREISGKGRLKKVADFLNLDYVPEEKVPFSQGVKTIKEQHHIHRQNKYRQLIVKFGNEVEMKVMRAKVLKREDVLAKKTTNAREFKKDLQKIKPELQNSRQEVSKKQEKIVLLETQKGEDKIKIYELEEKLAEQADKFLVSEQEVSTKQVEIETLKGYNNTLTMELETKEEQIILGVKIVEDNQKTIEDFKEEVQKLQKLTEPTGYEIEGEYVSETVYDYVEQIRDKFTSKSSIVDFLKEEVEAKNKLMNNERIRHAEVEKKLLLKAESLQIEKSTLNSSIEEKKAEIFDEKKKSEQKDQKISSLEKQVRDYEEIFSKGISDAYGYEDDFVMPNEENSDIMDNVAEYLNLTPEKLNELFEDNVPCEKDVIRSKKVIIHSTIKIEEGDSPPWGDLAP